MQEILLQQPQLSAQTFVIPLAEDEEPQRYLIYAPLRQSAFIANSRIVNFIADLKDGIYKSQDDPNGDLTEWLQQLEIINAGKEHRPITIFEGIPEPSAVTLFLTTACNLRCSYCYASSGDTPIKHMSIDVAKQGIDFVSDNAYSNEEPGFELNFHGGGEPTVNWKVLTAAYEYAAERAHELDLELTASTATNGVLNDTQIDWIISHLDGVSLSFDGDPIAQDTHRPTVQGNGSSERVLHTIRRLDAAGFPYGIRVTVTQDQIPHLSQSIEFICRNTQPRHIQVEPAYQMGRWKNEPSAETSEFIKQYRIAQQCAQSYGQELYYSAARVGLLTNHFCGVTQDLFALSPDGNVSSCFEVFSENNNWADEFFYGKPELDGSYNFNLRVLHRLRNMAVDHKPFCEGCFARWHCAGDCHHKSRTVSGDQEFRGSDRCHITRELTKDQILDRIQSTGGLFWHESPDSLQDEVTHMGAIWIVLNKTDTL